MRKFKIIESKEVIEYTEYEVIAADEEAAMNMVLNGLASGNRWIDNNDIPHFEVEEVEQYDDELPF